MSNIAFVNGRYLYQKDAFVNIEDRGYQFADGVYEVVAVSNSNLIDIEPHLDRLDRSLSELNIVWPCERRVLNLILNVVIKRNYLKEGILYLQITRGVAPRGHEFPSNNIRPSLIVTASRKGLSSHLLYQKGVNVVTARENRWARRDIKSVSLLPNVLAKQFAVDNGAFETWLVDENSQITEGASTNAWIVLEDGQLVTRHLGPEILSGITRMKVIELAKNNKFQVEQRPFTKNEAIQAKEAFLTSTTSLVMPVITIDGIKVGNGKPGNISLELLALYRQHMSKIKFKHDD